MQAGIVHRVVDAKNQGEAMRHATTRQQFLYHVTNDVRTLGLFDVWSEMHGIAAIVRRMAKLLDQAAQSAGLDHRAELRRQENAFRLAPLLSVLQRDEERYQQLLERSRLQRLKEALGFSSAVLYGTLVDEDVPIRGWLAHDLTTIYEAGVSLYVYGQRVQLGRPAVDTLNVVGKGQKPTNDGENLRRNATWYYLNVVAEPKSTIGELARQHREDCEARGIFHAPKESGSNKAATAKVTQGIKEASRLLHLSIPPEKWARFANFRQSGGKETLM